MDWRTWNAGVLIASGFIAGAFCASFVIAISEPSFKFDLDALAKVASVLVIPLTIGLVGFTAVLARETRNMWTQNRLPHVVVTLEPMAEQQQWMELVVENVGSGPAFDIAATLDPDIVRKGGVAIQVSASSLLHAPVLKPKQRFATFVGEWTNLEPQRSTVRCTCKDLSGASHDFSNEIDLRAFATLLSTGAPPLNEIADEMKKVRLMLERRFGS
jgi:hypothetical protein